MIIQLLQSVVSETTATKTRTIQPIDKYNQWYTTGIAEWTAAENDIITVTAWAPYEISNVTALLADDQLAVFSRARLFDLTVGREVPAGTHTRHIFRAIGPLKRYGNLTDIDGYSETFKTGSGELLTQGHRYTWSLDFMKQQVKGMPTLTLTIADFAVFSSAGTFN